jgi:hypothetical protein
MLDVRLKILTLPNGLRGIAGRSGNEISVGFHITVVYAEACCDPK